MMTPIQEHAEERAVALGAIRLDGNTQCRASLDMDHIASLVEAIEGGESLPPLVLFHDGSSFWLGDGFHRYHAWQRLDRAEVWAQVRSGTRADAVKYAVAANARHGLRRTNADKRRAVEVALGEFPGLSSRELSRLCAVSHVFVESVRRVEQPEQGEREGKDGKVYAAKKGEEPGEIAALPVSYALAEKNSVETPANDGREERLRELMRADREAKLPEIVSRARWCIQQLRAVGKRELAWLISVAIGSADYDVMSLLLAEDAAKRQGVVLPGSVLSTPVRWSSTLGLGMLENINQVATLRVMMEMHLEVAAQLVLERGASSDAADFIRWVLELDVLGFAEETPAGVRGLKAQLDVQSEAAA